MENINLLSLSDIDQILKITTSIWADEGNFSDYVIRKIIKDKLSYSIKIENEIICFYLINREGEAFNEGYISLICVKEKYRHKGLGYKIMKYCMDKAKNEGVNKFYLHVPQNNEYAINLYKKLGFIIKKSYKNFFHSKKNPESNPAYLMTKENKDNNNTKSEDQNKNKEKTNNKENAIEKKDIKEQIEHLDFKECINNNLNENYFLDSGIITFEQFSGFLDCEFEEKNSLNNSIDNFIEEKEKFLNKKRKFDSNYISDDENRNIEIKNTVIKDSKPQISQNLGICFL